MHSTSLKFALPIARTKPVSFVIESNLLRSLVTVSIQVVEAPSAVRPPLTLSVCPKGKVYLTKDLSRALGLKQGQCIELVPPRARNGGKWHLDVRPLTPLATLSILGCKLPQFEMRYTLSPKHFKGKLPGELLSRLTLKLLDEAPLVPGYYPLAPCFDAQPAQKLTPQTLAACPPQAGVSGAGSTYQALRQPCLAQAAAAHPQGRTTVPHLSCPGQGRSCPNGGSYQACA
ncbi:hypothetical protein ACW9KT_15525 [Hymenobacter sp. HD11105]